MSEPERGASTAFGVEFHPDGLEGCVSLGAWVSAVPPFLCRASKSRPWREVNIYINFSLSHCINKFK